MVCKRASALLTDLQILLLGLMELFLSPGMDCLCLDLILIRITASTVSVVAGAGLNPADNANVSRRCC